MPALVGYTWPVTSAVCELALPFLLSRWKYAFAIVIVIFIQPIFIDHKHGTEVGVEDRDSNNSNSDIKFTLY